MQLLSPQEAMPELPEEVVLVDAETGAADAAHVTPALVAAYREAQDAHCREIEAVCRSGGWTYLRARSDAPFEDAHAPVAARAGRASMRLVGLSPGLAAALLAAVAAVVVALYLLKPPPLRVTVAVQPHLGARVEAQASRRRAVALVAVARPVARDRTGHCLRHREAGGRTNPGTAGRQRVIVIDNSPYDGRDAQRCTHAPGACARRSARDRRDAAVRRGAIAVVDTMGTIVTPAFEARRQALARIDGIRRRIRWRATISGIGVADRWHCRCGDRVHHGWCRCPCKRRRRHAPFRSSRLSTTSGITAFEVRGLSPGPRVASRRSSPSPMPAAVRSVLTLTVAGAGHAAIEARDRDSGTRHRSRCRCPCPISRGGHCAHRCNRTSDGFDADDLAWAFLPLTKVARVALVTDGNRALEQALRLDPRIALTVLAPKQYAARTGFDAYVFDRFAPPVAPAAPALLFRPSGVPWLPAIRPVRESPTLESWLEDHPVLDNISLCAMSISGAPRRSPPVLVRRHCARPRGRWRGAHGRVRRMCRAGSRAALQSRIPTSRRRRRSRCSSRIRSRGCSTRHPPWPAALEPWRRPWNARAFSRPKVIPPTRASCRAPRCFAPGAPGVYTAEGAAGRTRVLANRAGSRDRRT